MPEEVSFQPDALYDAVGSLGYVVDVRYYAEHLNEHAADRDRYLYRASQTIIRAAARRVMGHGFQKVVPPKIDWRTPEAQALVKQVTEDILRWSRGERLWEPIGFQVPVLSPPSPLRE